MVLFDKDTYNWKPHIYIYIHVYDANKTEISVKFRIFSFLFGKANYPALEGISNELLFKLWSYIYFNST